MTAAASASSPRTRASRRTCAPVRPAGVQISGVTGEFSAVEGPDGLFDLSHPVDGSFSLQVDDLDLGNRFLTFGVRQWLGTRPVRGRLGEARPREDGTYLMQLLMELRGHEHLLEGSGYVDPPTETARYCMAG